MNDGVLNLVLVLANQFGIVWLECKMVPPRQHCIFTTLKKKKKNLKLSPPKHFINLIYHRKAYTGSRRAMLNLTVLKLFCFSLLLATLLKMQLSWGVWPDLQGKLFSSCLFLLFLNGKKKKKTHNARFLYLLLQHKSK